MRLAFLLVVLSVLPMPAFAQANQSFVQGFGGLRVEDTPSLTPTAGGTVGVGLTPYIQVIGEVGHISDVMPSTIETLMTVSPVTIHRSALYGEGGVRLSTGPAGHVGVYGETLFTCTMALLGAALSMLYFAFQTRWFALVGVLLAGYLAHFASKAFQLMGEFGYMAPFFAGWLAPLLLIVAVLGTLYVIQKKRGLGIQLADTPHYADSTSE